MDNKIDSDDDNEDEDAADGIDPAKMSEAPTEGKDGASTRVTKRPATNHLRKRGNGATPVAMVDSGCVTIVDDSYFQYSNESTDGVSEWLGWRRPAGMALEATQSNRWEH
ncbi:hypothetical protein OIO90_005675 [Microbotryomycetes sp. JL221]|nr:hypothetical protein OIO90_005675 [Microbotryomycetes sp. JL221]